MEEALRVGHWLSTAKHKRFRFDDFAKLCSTRNITLVALDLDRPIAEQGPFDCILHKLSDVWSKAEHGDENARRHWINMQNYTEEHGEVPLIDPLEAMTLLCDRAVQYEFLSSLCDDHGAIRCPDFVKLTETSARQNQAKISMMGVKFPAVCKPIVAHGSHDAHLLTLVLNANGITRLPTNYVAQTFHQHNGVLFKLFVIGDRHFTCIRPSLKNFSACEHSANIVFDSHQVSKEGCANELTECSPVRHTIRPTPPAPRILNAFVAKIRARTGLNLFGVDIIQDRHTGIYYAIDVNVFPSYDGVPNFHKHLIRLIRQVATRGPIVHEPIAVRVLKTTSTDVDVEKDREDDKQVRRRRNTRSGMHNRCSSNIVEYDSSQHTTSERVILTMDSGVGTSESETSDTNARLTVPKVSKSASRSLTRVPENERPALFPDWARIKRFYGIPKPSHFTVDKVHDTNADEQKLLDDNTRIRGDSIP